MPEYSPASDTHRAPFLMRIAGKIREKLRPDPMAGREMGGYLLEEKIAKGGMSTIYRAASPSGGRAAVKLLDEHFCRVKKQADNFILEAELMESISHPNVVKGLGHGTIDSVRLYAAMEYMEGMDAGKALKEADGRLAPDLALSIILQACRGLEAIHGKGVIHRDMKPENIMIMPDGRAAVLDMGIAKRLSDAGVGEWDGTIYGTIYYVAPEQTTGNDYDQRADIYSMGVTLYKMLCGRKTVESDDMRKLIFLIQSVMPRPPSEACPEAGISPEMDRIAMKALAKDPAARFQSAAEMADAIEKIISGRM